MDNFLCGLVHYINYWFFSFFQCNGSQTTTASTESVWYALISSVLFNSILFMLYSLGQDLKVVRYESPKPRPMVRPAYLSKVPSPAGMICMGVLTYRLYYVLFSAESFNFAVTHYQDPSLITWHTHTLPSLACHYIFISWVIFYSFHFIFDRIILLYQWLYLNIKTINKRLYKQVWFRFLEIVFFEGFENVW